MYCILGGALGTSATRFFSNDTFSVNAIAKWDGTTFHPLATGIDYCDNFNCSPIQSIFRYQDGIYSNDPTGSMSGVMTNGFVRWDGVAWSPASGDGLYDDFGFGGSVYSQIHYEGALLVGGGYTMIGDEQVNGLAYWDGEEWHSLNFPTEPDHFPFIVAMTKFNGDLYVAGNFQLIIDGEGTEDVARFDGVNWHPVDGGLKGGWATAWDLAVFKDELYVAGLIEQSEGNAGNNIMKLENGKWVDVAGGTDLMVRDMIVFEDEAVRRWRF